MSRYKLHMVSFKRKDADSYAAVSANGGNMLPEHLDVLEQWVAEQREKQDDADGLDLV